jgi:hypothetical protein
MRWKCLAMKFSMIYNGTGSLLIDDGKVIMVTHHDLATFGDALFFYHL